MLYPEFITPHVFPPNIPVLGFLRWYSLMYLVGFFIAFLMLRHFIKQQKLKLPLEGKGSLTDLIFYCVVGLIIGARLGDFIFYRPATFITAPWEILGFYVNAEGGLSFIGLQGLSYHGGMVGIIIAVVIFCKRFKHRFFQITDWIIIPVPLGLFFGRLGNFLNAELYGRVTDFCLAMRFPQYTKFGSYENWHDQWSQLTPAQQETPEMINKFYTQPRHPSQLYEAATEGLLLFIIMILLTRFKLKIGIRSGVYLIGYGLFRTLVEFVRAPSDWVYGWLTGGMFYSIPMVLIGIAMIIYFQRKPDAIYH